MARTLTITGAHGAQQAAVAAAALRAGHAVRATARIPPADAPPSIDWHAADRASS